jgi:hypothetical protein
MKRLLSILFLMGVMGTHTASAQSNEGKALLRSLILPGWGQYYNQPDNWTIGKVHLAADIALISGYFGFSIHADRLHDNLLTQSKHYAGADIAGRPLSFKFALARYDNLDEYNEQMLRSRNWDQVLPDVPENQWQWQDESSRNRYVDLINREDKARNQLPAIASLMVVNRVLAGVGAYRQARNSAAYVSVESGVTKLNLRLSF